MVETVHGRGNWGRVSGGQVCKGAELPGRLSQALKLDLWCSRPWWVCVGHITCMPQSWTAVERE